MDKSNIIPQYLYHYTSVDNLELILSNRTIRFNPLTKMDDPEEKWNAHGNAIGYFWFISSWTEEKEEIANMWREYCRPDASRGVRIRLPVNPFSRTENKFNEASNAVLAKMVNDTRGQLQLLGKYLLSQIDEHQEIQNCFMTIFSYFYNHNRLNEEDRKRARETSMCFTPDVDKLWAKVEYTEDNDKLFPVMMHVGDEQIFVDNSVFCKYKRTDWSYQKEWRYILCFGTMVSGIRVSNNQFNYYPIDINYWDLLLDAEKLQNMEVVTSPVITAEALNKLGDILRRYFPTARVMSSRLNGLD